jgi:cysteinyl-tRNA synthetase
MASPAPLRLHNSLTSRVEDFVPLTPGRVGIYSCGPTVYSYAHLGNLRAYVFSDVLRRTLEWRGFGVDQVVNITDVGHTVGESDLGEDKVEAAARRELRSVQELTRHYTEAFQADLAALRIKPPTHQPRASEYVPQMVEFARVLEQRGVTYQLSDGLYFDTAKDPEYGVLAKAKAGLLEQRELSAEGKRHPADFAVWRADTATERRVMRWDSPWGPGVPGWHLECSVMSLELLGRHFDIHTGGVDHREIHHVNEMAQSGAFLGEPDTRWVRTWMHNEFLVAGGRKISKSAGRMPLLRDIVAGGRPALAYRYLVLMAHYRRQLDFTEENLVGQAAGYARFIAHWGPGGADTAPTTFEAAAAQLGEAGREWLTRIDAALADDLNTPRALAEIRAMMRSDLPFDEQRRVVLAVDSVLGLGVGAEPDAGGPGPSAEDPRVPEVEQLLADRQQARADRDFARADQLRDRLRELAVEVTDTPEGPTWRFVSGDPAG